MPTRRIPALVPTLLLLAIGAVIAACGGPSPTNVLLTVTASPQVNPNSDNQPSPTVVRFYDLKSPDTFNSASFFDLYDDDTKRLGADMLGRKEIEVQPGKTMHIDSVAAPGTLFLGVLAGFRDLDGALWRAVVDFSWRRQSDQRYVAGTLHRIPKAPLALSRDFLNVFGKQAAVVRRP